MQSVIAYTMNDNGMWGVMPCTLVWTSFEHALTSLGLALVHENHHQMALAGTNDSSTEKGKQVACYRTNCCANCSAPILGIHGSHMAAIAQSWRGRAGRRWLRRTQATFLRRPTCQELAIFTNLDPFSLIFIAFHCLHLNILHAPFFS